jgi:uncharacterized protein with gpF-like domain
MGAMLFAGSEYDYNLSSQVASALDKRVGFFTQKINETTFKKLQREITESLAEGETRRQLVDRIYDTYGNISKARAGVIARTELQVANNEGIFDGYKQAGMPTKIWVWAVGVQGGVRDEHLAMDGEEVPFNQPFSNGLMKPGDFSGSAEEVVNCQCVLG